MAVIVDSSIWIAYLSGAAFPQIELAATNASLVISPLVVAEILSGDLGPDARLTFGELLQDFPIHRTPLSHWMAVGELRRMLRARGINATIPDAHVAQCALDLDATLLSGDAVFLHIARHTPLRVAHLR